LNTGSIYSQETPNKIKKDRIPSIFNRQYSIKYKGVNKMSEELKQKLNELKVKLEHLRSYL